jgi:hypothetical protein
METVEQLIEFSLADRRVCPRPQKWNQLWEIISSSQTPTNVPPPLILAAWWHTSDGEKRQRLALQLRHAQALGKLPQAAEFLASLSKGEWTLEGEAG